MCRKRLGAARLVQALAHFLAGLEERHGFLLDRNMRAGARVAAGARGPMFHGKRAKAAKLDAVTMRHGARDLVEDRVDDVLDVALIEMWILAGDALDKFGLDHDAVLPSQLDPGGCQSARRPSRFSRSTAC